MPIAADVAAFAPGALVELYDLDMTSVGLEVAYFHSGLSQVGTPVVWRGNTYQPWPIQATGFSKTVGGKFPRPTLQVANVDGTVTALLLAYNDLVGCKLTRHRTLAQYLDAVNFPNGANPTADPTQELPPDVYYIAQKASEDNQMVVFSLAAACDLSGIYLPARQVNAFTCTVPYKSAYCGYVPGPMFDASGNAVSDSSLDVCSHQLATGCKPRWYGQAGSTKGVPLPFGGFPGVTTGAGISST